MSTAKRWWKGMPPFLLATLLLAGVAMAQGTMWVGSQGAKVQSEQSASSNVLQSLDVGTKVTVLSQSGSWYQVKTPTGTVGWMYRGRLTDSAPAEETTSSDAGLFAGLGGSGMSVSEADTSRSVRGLSPETEAYAKRVGTPEQIQRALDEVLEPKVTPESLEKFLKNGKIGEYAMN